MTVQIYYLDPHKKFKRPLPERKPRQAVPPRFIQRQPTQDVPLDDKPAPPIAEPKQAELF